MVIRDRIAELYEMGTTEAHTIAETLVREVQQSELRTTLGEIMPVYVRQVLSQQRMNTLSQDVPEYGQPYGEEHARPDGKPANYSAKLAGRRTWFASLLSMPTHHGPFGRCTFDELMAEAADRQEHASAVLYRAGQYEQTAHALKEHDAQCPQELPEDVIAAIWRADA